MNNIDFAYIDLINQVIDEGTKSEDRTGTGTIKSFSHGFKINCSEILPIISLKKVAFKSALTELLFFLGGRTNLKWLIERKCYIWTEWPLRRFNDAKKTSITKKEFHRLILNDEVPNEFLDMGPLYGAQWRNYNGSGLDQLSEAENQIKINGNSRRIIVSAWNPLQIHKMELPPCHKDFQFQVQKINGQDYLNLNFCMRSVDVFLGLPFDLLSYGILLNIMAKKCGLRIGKLGFQSVDTHIYLNHLNQIDELKSRYLNNKKFDVNYTKPKLIISDKIIDCDWSDIKSDWFQLIDYNPDNVISGSVAV